MNRRFICFRMENGDLYIWAIIILTFCKLKCRRVAYSGRRYTLLLKREKITATTCSLDCYRKKGCFILAEGIHPSSYLLERKPCFLSGSERIYIRLYRFMRLNVSLYVSYCMGITPLVASLYAGIRVKKQGFFEWKMAFKTCFLPSSSI